MVIILACCIVTMIMTPKQTLIPIWLLCAAMLRATALQAATTVTNIAGCYHTLFLKSDGSLWGMGGNDVGQLGDGTSRVGNIVNYTNRPELIVSNGVVAISAGNSHTLFVKSDGSLWGMGDNSAGELGDGTTNQVITPEQIIPNGVTAVAAGTQYSLFLKSGGSLWAMGMNISGQLGDGTFNNTNRPEQIISGGVTAIAAGWDQSLFLKSDGSLWGMGGVLNATTNQPEQIVSNEVTAIAIGKHDRSLFLKSGGTLWSMAINSGPQLVVSSNVISVACGSEHGLFLKSDGSLWALGSDDSGQLGNGIIEDATFPPMQIVSNGVVAVAAGAQHSLFIKSDGSLWGMGLAGDGELGDGFYGTTNWQQSISSVPEQIVPPPRPLLTGISISTKTNLQFKATCLFGGKYCLLSSTYLAQQLNQWKPVWTNSVIARGTNNFTAMLTNAVNSSASQFYILQSQ